MSTATVKQAAKLLDLNPLTVRRLAREGEFPGAFKDNSGCFQIPLSEVDGYAERSPWRRSRSAPAPAPKAPVGDAKVREVSAYLGIDPETVRVLARQGFFPNAYKTGASFNHPIRIPWSDVEDYRRKQPRVNQ